MKHIADVELSGGAKALTMADVKQLIECDQKAVKTRQRDDLSAIRCLNKWSGLPLDNIAATHSAVRNEFDKFSPGGIGVSKRRLENVRSSINRILQRISAPQVRRNQPMSNAWRGFVDKAGSDGDKNALSKFARYCTMRGLAAEQIDDKTSSLYLAHLEQGSFVDKPRLKHQALCRAWNRLVSKSGSNCIKVLALPSYADRYGIVPARFPKSLQDEIAAYRTYLICADPLADKAPAKPLRPVSADLRVKQLYSAASALVHAGVPIAEVDQLAVLVDVENMKKILKFHLDRSNNQKTKMMSDIAQGLVKVALRFLETPPEQLDQLRALKKRVKVEMNQMTEKNRSVLQHFNNPTLIKRFRELPMDMFNAALVGEPTNKKAILAQKAIAIAILTCAPMRLKNLGGLNLTQHLNWNISPDKVLINIPSHEVKNEEDLVFELTKPVTAMVKTYIEQFRPHLLQGRNDYLFPGQENGPKSSNNLSQQIATTTDQYLGVRLTAHQFRHVAGKIFLDNNPGQYEVLRRVLAHRAIETTIAYYAGEETRSAVQHFQDNIFGDMTDAKLANKGGRNS